MSIKNCDKLAERIRQFRRKQGLTQEALARKADVPYTTLTKIESNVINKPTIQTVAKIAHGLQVKIDDLL